MNYLNTLREQLSNKERLYSLLPIGVIIVIVLGYVLFIALSIVPQVKALQDVSAQLDEAEKKLANVQEKANQESPEELNQKIEAAQTRLNEAADVFLSESQAAEALNKLYQYASESGVVIADLQSQPSPKVDDKGLYDVRTFGVQVEGILPGLINFVTRLREATLKSFFLSNVSITEGEGLYTLAMDVVLYTSPYASGSSSEETLPTPGIIPTPTSGVPPTLTPDVILTPTPASQATPVPSPTPTVVETPSPTPTLQPGTVYEVRQGDTLYSIARRYGVTVEDIMAANGLENYNIYAGQKLHIPTR